MSSAIETDLPEGAASKLRPRSIRSALLHLTNHRDALLLIVCATVILLAKVLIVLQAAFLVARDAVVFTDPVEGVDPLLVALGNQWDSRYFISIALSGYPAGVENDVLYAFAPLYPMLLRLAGPLIGDYYVAGIIVSNIFYVLSLLAFYLVAGIYMERTRAILSTTAFALFPTYLVYSTVAYTESTALFFAIISWYLLERDRYLLSSIALTGAILTRYVFALAVPVYFIVILWRTVTQDDSSRMRFVHLLLRISCLLTPVAAVSLLFLYFQSLTGNFFVMIDSHIFFDDHLTTPLGQFEWFFTGFFTRINHLNPVEVLVVRYAFTIPMLLMVVALAPRRRGALLLYGLVAMYFTLSMAGISAVASPRIALTSWVALLTFDERTPWWLYPMLFALFVVVGLWVMQKFLTSFFA